MSLNDDKCRRCNKKLSYGERHYITETKGEAVSVWCYSCFKWEVARRSGKEGQMKLEGGKNGR